MSRLLSGNLKHFMFPTKEVVLFTVFIAKCHLVDASSLELLKLNDCEHLSWSLVQPHGLNEYRKQSNSLWPA